MDISSLGEFALIARLTRGLSAGADVALGVGDDCAILDLNTDMLLLATCDSQVEGIHFTQHTSTPEQIGRKALAVNLSDIAAMGGEPRYVLVSLILPQHLSFAVLDGIYAGLRSEAEQFGVSIVGGNIAGSGASEQLVIDITLLGTVERLRVLTRGGASVGDTLCVTGVLGDAAAGLSTLLAPDPRIPQEIQEPLRAAHRTPRPRIHEGRILSRFGPEIITSLLDISDGLSGDLGHLCERSHVGATIEAANLPISPAMRAVAASLARDPVAWALHGGEDYELLFTVKPGYEQAIIEAIRSETGTPVTVIGAISPASSGLQLLHPDGRSGPLTVQSWDHLQGSS